MPYEVVPLTRTQITTGRRMSLSSQSIPQFALEVDVDMTEAQRLRQHIGESRGSKPGYTAILVRVVAAALQAYPQVNASFDGESVLRYKEINVGVAVAGPEGLLVPVIHAADRLHLDQIQAQLEEIRAQAERGVLDPVYLSGGTFTVSNLGMYGIDRFLALVNPPQAAILAAGRIRQLPWAVGNTIEARPVLTLRLSVDHRVLDGSTAAPFLGEVRQLLRIPIVWFRKRMTKITHDEYRQRAARLQAAMEAEGLDALLVYSWKRGLVRYVSGYHPNFVANQAVVVLPRQGPPALRIRFPFDLARARRESWIDDISASGSPAQMVYEAAGVIQARGLAQGRIGLATGDNVINELPYTLYSILQSALPDAALSGRQASAPPGAPDQKPGGVCTAARCGAIGRCRGGGGPPGAGSRSQRF